MENKYYTIYYENDDGENITYKIICEAGDEEAIDFASANYISNHEKWAGHNWASQIITPSGKIIS